MRIALFVTCLADTLFPEAGRATVRLLERLGHQVEFPAAQTCCGQMHVNTGYLRDALPLVRRYVEVFEACEAIVVPSGSCTGSIRHQHAMVARRYGDEALARRAEAVGRPHLRTLPAADRRARGGGRRRLLPAPGHLPSDLPLAADAPRRRPPAPAAAPRGRYRPGRAARRRHLLRVRRHVRGQERGHVHGHAGRQDAQRAGHPGRGVHGRGQLLPDAHRRRPVPAASGHPDRAPGGDPGLGAANPSAANRSAANRQVPQTSAPDRQDAR